LGRSVGQNSDEEKVDKLPAMRKHTNQKTP
jgi:hypothetical protein